MTAFWIVCVLVLLIEIAYWAALRRDRRITDTQDIVRAFQYIKGLPESPEIAAYAELQRRHLASQNGREL